MIFHYGTRSDHLECGDSSPLSLTATRCREARRADESTREKAASSRRTPKLGSVRPHTLFAGVECVKVQKGRIAMGRKFRPCETMMRNQG
jgi:hypothetical protein